LKWVTRERPKTDRIACPWLIRNFIDSDAEFLYVPADEVLAVGEQEGAHSYDAPGARYTHRDGLCSFEVLVEEYGIDDPAIALLARIVHGADVAEDRDATPQSRGLLAVAEGFHLPVPHFRNLTQRGSRLRSRTRESLERPLGTEHAGIQPQPLSRHVAHALQALDPHVELRIGPAPLTAWEARQILLRDGEAALDGGEERVAALLDQPARYAGDPLQVLGCARHRHGDGEQRLVPHHAEARAIQLGRDCVAPVHQLPQQGEAAPRQEPRTLDPEVGVTVRLERRPAQVLEPRELLLGPAQPVLVFERGAQLVAQCREVSGVGRRVVEHLGRQRPPRPVGSLVLLVELHGEVLLEQCRQPYRGLTEELRRDARVEQPPRAHPVVAVQDPQVVVGVVEDHLDRGIGEDRAERRDVANGQWIDDGGFAPGRELDEVDAVDEAVEAGGLGINGEERLAGYPLREGLQLARCAHIPMRGWLPRARDHEMWKVARGGRYRNCERTCLSTSPRTCLHLCQQ